MNSSIIGMTFDFDVFKLGDAFLINDAGEWGQEPNINSVGVLRSTNFSNEGYLSVDDIAYRTLSPRKLIDKRLESADILIERSGGSTTQPVGRVGFIDQTISDKGLVFANFIQRIRLDPDIFNSKYVYYCLQQMYEMGITSSMQFQTTGIRNLDYKYYVKSRIPKPTKDEQKAIAGILSKVDEAIAAVESSIKAAERFKKSLMQNLLTGKLKPDGSWRNEDEFYVDENLGKVPKGWEVKPLKELSTIQRGKFSHRPRNEPRFYGGEHPFVQTSDVVNSAFYLRQYTQTLSDLGVMVSRKFEKGTIIITIAANIGDVAISKYDVFFPDSLIGIESFSEKVNAEYLLLSLMTKKPFLNQVATESAQKNINYGNLRPLPIFHPKDLTEQAQVTEKIETVFNMIESKQSKSQSLKTLKKSLMQNLLTGKVRVNVEKINKLLEEV